jgi:hypothetical protein
MGLNCRLRLYLIHIDSPTAAGFFKLASSAATSSLTLTLRGHDWRFALTGSGGGFDMDTFNSTHPYLLYNPPRNP